MSAVPISSEIITLERLQFASAQTLGPAVLRSMELHQRKASWGTHKTALDP